MAANGAGDARPPLVEPIGPRRIFEIGTAPLPVLVNLDSHDHHLVTRARNVGAKALSRSHSASVDCVDIGLINNMPDSALVSTERQVFDLLNAAAGELTVRLHLYSMETTPRTDWGRDYVRRFYRGINDLLDTSLDGLIVTGAEPKAASLTEEPYWASFGQTIDWAKENTSSSIYSCLAVHGAVLHLDGVERHPLADKCIGVFTQTKTTDHPLMLGVSSHLRIPHSRWNEVREGPLKECGYTILTNSAEVGVDSFVKQHKRSLFVYFQGHPEYDAQSLLGEYRRDIGRFLRRESENYPTMPKDYFGRDAEEALITFKREALSDRRPEVFASFPVDRLAQDLKNTWHSAAKRMYRNWIQYLSSQKIQRSKSLAVPSFV
jgi:homoserine O-succinyltransferase/O-acetyltransferase